MTTTVLQIRNDVGLAALGSRHERLGTSLFSRWPDPRQPLYVAALFQVVILGLILANQQYAAVVFVGGTIGCLITSLRLQRERHENPDPVAR